MAAELRTTRLDRQHTYIATQFFAWNIHPAGRSLRHPSHRAAESDRSGLRSRKPGRRVRRDVLVAGERPAGEEQFGSGGHGKRRLAKVDSTQKARVPSEEQDAFGRRQPSQHSIS